MRVNPDQQKITFQIIIFILLITFNLTGYKYNELSVKLQHYLKIHT